MGDQPEKVTTVAAELRGVVAHLVRRLREQTDASDLTRSQSSVLGRIERDGPSSASSLARAEGMRPQSMAAIITALESAGLIVGAADPRDGRKTLWSLTEKAREEYRTGRRAKEDWLAQAIGATLTADEVERLAASIDLLRKLARA